MTDEQIIKALECCIYDTTCQECPYNKLSTCIEVRHKNLLGVINRQKAEIDRLEQELEQAKLEAIKEFAVRLKNKIWYSDWCNLERTITPEIITTVVKEMTEEKQC